MQLEPMLVNREMLFQLLEENRALKAALEELVAAANKALEEKGARDEASYYK